jgi:hypothetical protein
MSIINIIKTLLILMSIPILTTITAVIVLVHVIIIAIMLLSDEIIGLVRK